MTAGTLTVETAAQLDAVNCETLKVGTLVTTDATLDILFATQIANQSQVNITTHNVAQAKSGLSTWDIIDIVFTVLSIAAVVVGIGSALLAARAVMLAQRAYQVAIIAEEAIAAEELSSTGAMLAVQDTLYARIVAGATRAAVFSVALPSIGAGAATAVIGAVLFQAPQPFLNTVAINATYGNSFLSDIIFGTTSTTDAAAGYTEFMLLQNETHGSYALPRWLGYNPQLGTFDDHTAYGGVEAYLSLCTLPPFHTLRFQSNGNLAIYAAIGNTPVWSSGTQVSSAIHKKNTRKIEDACQKIEKLDAVYYTYTDRAEQQVGLIAQQLEEVLPEAVFGDEEGGYRVRLERVVPLLIEAIKELYWEQEKILGVK
jgi:hypothetical protein